MKGSCYCNETLATTHFYSVVVQWHDLEKYEIIFLSWMTRVLHMISGMAENLLLLNSEYIAVELFREHL